MLGLLRWILRLVVVVGVVIVAGRLIFPLPSIEGRAYSHAIPADPATRMGTIMERAAREHPGQSGVLPLSRGHDALGSRLVLATLAERSIDAQYYIWHDDVSGRLLLQALLDASRRGVRVRLLLDDNGVPGLDQTMAALNAQDNFEIRLFNPSTVRSPKLAGYAIDFMRMNRRMHNKAFLVDGGAAIIGGRNIGDEYFQVGEDDFYLDLDVLAVGAIVPETVTAFDRYWNSASVFAVEQVIDGTGDLAAFEAGVDEVLAQPETQQMIEDMRTTSARAVGRDSLLEWTDVQLAVDDPVKGEGLARPDQLMINRLGQIIGEVNSQLDLVSAYFVPGIAGETYFAGLAGAGKRVRILTNALNTTDVLLVHAGYTKYRRELLQAGVELYELKLRAGQQPGKAEQLNPFGLSGASLHAKTFALDDSRVFIGSFNFDPRSAMLNCEMGFLIDSPAMARRVSGAFDNEVANVSYRPQLTPEDRMVWQESKPDGSTEIYQSEPGASWFQNVAIVIIGLLPVEWMT